MDEQKHPETPGSASESPVTLAATPAKSSRFLPLVAFGLAVFYALCLCAPIIGLLIYIRVTHYYLLDPFDGNYGLSTASPTRILTFTQASSTTMKWFIGPTASVLAWFVAARWARCNGLLHSEDSGGSTKAVKDHPTADQFATVQQAFISAEPTALFGALFYSTRMPKWNKTMRARTIRLPTYFKVALSLLAAIVALTCVCTALDLAIHLTTSESEVPLPTIVDEFPKLGRLLNNTDAAFSAIGNFGADDNNSGPSVLQTRTNTSDDNWMAWTDNATAVLIFPDEIKYSYIASSIAIRATCESISDRCIPSNVTVQAEDASVANATDDYTLDCTGSPQASIQNVTAQGQDFSTPMDPEGNPVYFQNLATNPFHFAAVVHSRTYVNAFRKSGFVIAGTGKDQATMAWNAMLCQVTFGQVQYVYDSYFDKYIEQNFTPADLNDTSAYGHMVDLAGPLLAIPNPDIAGITYSIDGTGMRLGSEAYSSAFERALAKNLLSYTTLMATPDTESVTLLGTSVQGSRFLWPLLLVYGLCVAFLAILTILAGGLALYAGLPPAPLARSLHQQLTSPATGPDAPDTTEESEDMSRADFAARVRELVAAAEDSGAEGRRGLVLRQTWAAGGPLGLVNTLTSRRE